jgi:hypothetical protein
MTRYLKHCLKKQKKQLKKAEEALEKAGDELCTQYEMTSYCNAKARLNTFKQVFGYIEYVNEYEERKKKEALARKQRSLE